MIEEGYAAVSTRRVAAKAGLKPALVHYYFITTDDLFLATYKRGADWDFKQVRIALESSQPLTALWELSLNTTRTTLAVEFMALANHRKSIGAEIARSIERTREAHSQFLARLPAAARNKLVAGPPVVASLLIAALSRALVMEDGLGVSSGHAETLAFVQSWIRRNDRATPVRPKSKRAPKTRA